MLKVFGNGQSYNVNYNNITTAKNFSQVLRIIIYVRFASLNHYVFSTLPNSSVIFSAFACLFIKNILLIYHRFSVQLTINTSDRDGTPVRRTGCAGAVTSCSAWQRRWQRQSSARCASGNAWLDVPSAGSSCRTESTRRVSHPCASAHARLPSTCL